VSEESGQQALSSHLFSSGLLLLRLHLFFSSFPAAQKAASITHNLAAIHQAGPFPAEYITHTHTLFYYAHFLYIYFPQSARSLASILSSFSTCAHATLCCVPCHNNQHFTFLAPFFSARHSFSPAFQGPYIPDKEKLLRRILSTWDIKKSDDVVVKAFGPLLKTKNKENSTPL